MKLLAMRFACGACFLAAGWAVHAKPPAGAITEPVLTVKLEDSAARAARAEAESEKEGKPEEGDLHDEQRERDRSAPGANGEYEVHEWSVWLLDLTATSANEMTRYPSALPALAESSRDRARKFKSAQVPPLSLISLYGKPANQVEVEVRLKAGKFIGYWPAAVKKGSRLRWTDAELLPQADLTSLASIDAGGVLEAARRTSALFLKVSGRTERFVAYDCETGLENPLRLTFVNDRYILSNAGAKILNDIVLCVPTAEGYRIAWLDRAEPTKATSEPAKATAEPAKAAADITTPTTGAVTVEVKVETKVVAKDDAESAAKAAHEADSAKKAATIAEEAIKNQAISNEAKKNPTTAAEAKDQDAKSTEAKSDTEELIVKSNPPTPAASKVVVQAAADIAAGDAKLVEVKTVEAKSDAVKVETKTGETKAAETKVAATKVEEKPGKSYELTLSAPLAADSAELKKLGRDELARRLAATGLRQEQVNLLVDHYQAAIFNSDSLMVAFRAPAEMLEEQTPISVYPEPQRTVRTGLIIVSNLDPKLAGDLDSLVGKLGAERWSDRQEASAKLLGLGALAFPALRKGITNADPEIAQRCERLLLAQGQPAETPANAQATAVQQAGQMIQAVLGFGR